METARAPGAMALLFGLLAAPLAFLIDLGIGFALVERACHSGEFIEVWTVKILALVVAVAGLWRAWTIRRADPPDPRGRTRFMAISGIALSAFFLAMILASILPVLVLSPCD